MENPIKMDDLGVPLFLETPMCLGILPQSSVSSLPSAKPARKVLFFCPKKGIHGTNGIFTYIDTIKINQMFMGI